MRSTLLSLASLVVALAACGPQNGATSSEKGAESGQEAVVGGPAVTPDEPANLIGTFIATVGEHAIDSAGEFEIHVVRDNGLLNYRVQIRHERATTMGPKHASIDPSSNWFIHVESERRYWVFDGASGVTLFEYKGTPKRSEVAMTDLSRASDRLLAEMPDRVKDRIPADVLPEKR